MNVCDLFANVTATKAASGWSCGFTDDSMGAPGKFRKKTARFGGITVVQHTLWWEDWSFVEKLKEFAHQEFPVRNPMASSDCVTPGRRNAQWWGEIALLLESVDRNQMRSFGDSWLNPDGTPAIFYTDRLVEVLANCYTSPSGLAPVDQANPDKARPMYSTEELKAIYSPAELEAIELYNEGKGMKPRKIDDLILSKHSKPQRWTGVKVFGNTKKTRTQTTTAKPTRWVKGDAAKLIRQAKDNSVITKKKRRVS